MTGEWPNCLDDCGEYMPLGDRLAEGAALSALEHAHLQRGGPIICRGPQERMDAAIARDEYTARYDVDHEDPAGRLPFEEGYSGNLDLPDVHGRAYYQHGYAGPDPAKLALRSQLQRDVARRLRGLSEPRRPSRHALRA